MFDCMLVNDTTAYFKEVVPKEDWPETFAIGRPETFIIETPLLCEDVNDGIEPKSPYYVYSVVVIYGVILVISLIGNSLVVITVMFEKTMRTVTNMLLLSLSAGDLLITILSIPYHIMHALTSFNWQYGDVMCKLPQYIKGISVTASILSLTAISVERYLAILHPLAAQRYLSRLRLTVTVVMIWAIAFVVYIPMLVRLGVNEQKGTIPAFDETCNHTVRVQYCKYFTYCITFSYWGCVEEWESQASKRIYSLCLFLLLFCLPVVLMGLLYGKVAVHLWFWRPAGDHSTVRLRNVNTKRVVRVLIFFIVVFILCWAPYFVFQVLRDFGYEAKGCEMCYYLYGIFSLIAHADSAINPFLYALMSQRFRERLSPCCKTKTSIANSPTAANITPLETVTKRTRASTFGETQPTVAPIHVSVKLN